MNAANSMPLVSIGLPVHNGENFVAPAIESILIQTFEDFELIICDNGSTDATEQICREFADRDSRIRYHRNEKNLGASKNFNLTFELARGKYFKWAAHDDVLDPEFVARCVEALDIDDDVVLAHCRVRNIDPEGEFIQNYDQDLEQTASTEPHRRFADVILIEHLCFEVFGLFRRDVLARTRLIGRHISTDRNLLAEVALLGRYYQVPDRLLNIRYHSTRSVSKGRHDRAEMFDPTLKGKMTMPHWRMGWEYFRSVLRVPMDIREKLACMYPILRWSGRNWRLLRGDIRIALRLRKP